MSLLNSSLATRRPVASLRFIFFVFSGNKPTVKTVSFFNSKTFKNELKPESDTLIFLFPGFKMSLKNPLLFEMVPIPSPVSKTEAFLIISPVFSLMINPVMDTDWAQTDKDEKIKKTKTKHKLNVFMAILNKTVQLFKTSLQRPKNNQKGCLDYKFIPAFF